MQGDGRFVAGVRAGPTAARLPVATWAFIAGLRPGWIHPAARPRAFFSAVSISVSRSGRRGVECQPVDISDTFEMKNRLVFYTGPRFGLFTHGTPGRQAARSSATGRDLGAVEAWRPAGGSGLIVFERGVELGRAVCPGWFDHL